MPFIAGIGHRLSLQDLLDKFEFEDLDEAEAALEEAGLIIFTNDTDDVFIVIDDKYKIIESNKYYDLNFTLTPDEEHLLTTYTGQTDKRIKLFWIESEEDETQVDSNNMIASLCEKLGKSLELDGETI